MRTFDGKVVNLGVEDDVREGAGLDTRKAVGASLGHGIGEVVCAEVRRAVRKGLGFALGRSVGARVGRCVGCCIGAIVGRGVRQNVGEPVGPSDGLPNEESGRQWALALVPQSAKGSRQGWVSVYYASFLVTASAAMPAGHGLKEGFDAIIATSSAAAVLGKIVWREEEQ